MPPMRRPLLALLGIAVFLLADAVGAARRGATERALQATVASRGWTFEVRGRQGRVVAPDGARQRFRARPDEVWLAFEESAEGWMAAGVRPDREGLELTVLADLGRGPRRIAPPADRRAALRTGVVPVPSRDGVEGIAWLEGDHPTRFEVRFAALEDGGWGEPATLARPIGGSQSGLVAQPLDDGRTLLVWSRYDGHDDELYWALRETDGSWTAARRVTPANSVPDVTPALLPAPGGAWLAWSRLEPASSEYHVRLARFENGSWSASRDIGGPGSLFPQFRRLERGDYLLVRNAFPAGWTVYDLAIDGAPTRSASVVEESRDAPVLVDAGRTTPDFRWPLGRGDVALEWESVP